MSKNVKNGGVVGGGGTGLDPSKLVGDQNLIIFKNWVDKLQSEFPTADVVGSDRNSITIKIRYDDVFRALYKEVKKSVPDSKVSLKPCDYDKKYGLCMVIKTRTIVVGWEEWGFDKPVEVSGEGEFTYYVTFESMVKAFDYAWRVNNKGKPLTFKFTTRKIVPRSNANQSLTEQPPREEVWHYITINFVTVTAK